MRPVWNAAEKDLRRLMRDPLALVLWLGIPLFVGALLSLVMGGSRGPVPTAKLLVADADDSVLTNLLVQASGQRVEGNPIQVERIDEAEGRVRIGRGEASALVIIPNGFTEAVLQEQPTKLVLVTNPAERILPRIIEESLEIASEGTFYLHRVLGTQIRELVPGPPQGERTFSNQDIARISVAFNQTIAKVQKYVFPPVIDVETAVDKSAQPAVANPSMLFFPGILFMALLFLAEGMATDIWREHAQGTLRRAACSPASVGALLAGKVVAAAITMAACMLIVLLIGMTYFQIPLRHLPAAWAWSSLSAVALLQFFTTIQLVASSQRAGAVLSNCIMMPLLFVGGSFFPFEMMPGWMADFGRLTPNGWALQHLKDILMDHGVPAVSWAVLIVAATILFFLNRFRLRSFTRS